ncbi:MAG: hypothetical protein WBH03_18720, partial [Cyclobacteriaceae bacterium]
MDLPKELNGHTLRRIQLNDFFALEYSKTPSFNRYLSGGEIRDSDLLYEVRGSSDEEVEYKMSRKLELLNICKDDFEGYALLEYNPSFSYIDPKTNRPIVFKAFSAIYIWDIENNARYVAIISVDFDYEYKFILKWVMDFVEQDWSKNIRLAGDGFNTDDLIFTNTIFLYTTNFETNIGAIRKDFTKNKLVLNMRDDAYREANSPKIFICHDSRDKE